MGQKYTPTTRWALGSVINVTALASWYASGHVLVIWHCRFAGKLLFRSGHMALLFHSRLLFV